MFSRKAESLLCCGSGAPAGFENILSRAAWSREDGGKRVAVGGADRTVTIWEVESGRVLYKVCVLNSRLSVVLLPVFPPRLLVICNLINCPIPSIAART